MWACELFWLVLMCPGSWSLETFLLCFPPTISVAPRPSSALFLPTGGLEISPLVAGLAFGLARISPWPLLARAWGVLACKACSWLVALPQGDTSCSSPLLIRPCCWSSSCLSICLSSSWFEIPAFRLTSLSWASAAARLLGWCP